MIIRSNQHSCTNAQLLSNVGEKDLLGHIFCLFSVGPATNLLGFLLIILLSGPIVSLFLLHLLPHCFELLGPSSSAVLEAAQNLHENAAIKQRWKLWLISLKMYPSALDKSPGKLPNLLDCEGIWHVWSLLLFAAGGTNWKIHPGKIHPWFKPCLAT